MSKTSISALQEFTQSSRMPSPIYTEISIQLGIVNSFTIRCSCEGINADGEGPNKKIAKHRAAGKMIKMLRSEKNYRINYWESDSPPRSASISPVAQTLSLTPEPFINHVGKLQEFCEAKHTLSPEYRQVSTMGPNHLTEFTIECKIGRVCVTGTGMTKKQAKQSAAAAMRECLTRDYKLVDQSDATVNTKEGSVDELILPLNEIKISESSGLKTATERAKNFFPRLKKNLGVVTVSQTKLTISNFHKAFKASFDNQTLERFYHFWAHRSFEKYTSLSDLKQIFQRICEILDVSSENRKMKVKTVDQYVVCYELKSTPPYVDVGVGNSCEEAHANALRRIVTAIHLLLI